MNFFRHHVSLPLFLLAAIELAIFAVAPVVGARLLWFEPLRLRYGRSGLR